MDIQLNIILLSHLNDLDYDIQFKNVDRAKARNQFIKSLLFHNEDTAIRVETDYLDFMWKQAETRGAYDCSYQEWLSIKESELVK